MSQFPLKQGAVSLKLRTGENCRHWGILGISLLNSMIPDRDLPETFYVKEGKEWANFTFQKDIVKGSFLDFSGQNHAPAGKFGHMIANAKGQLSFEKEPSKRFRIVGANFAAGSVFRQKEKQRPSQDALRHWATIWSASTVTTRLSSEKMPGPVPKST